MFSRFNLCLAAILFVLSATLGTIAQETKPKEAKPTPVATPVTNSKTVGKLENAEQVAESAVFIYGFPGFLTSPIGRERLNQIRKTTLERGSTTLTASDGKVERATYQRFIIRGENLAKEKIRLDQDFPSAKYSLVFNDEKIFGIYNNTVFSPRQDASKGFENQIAHGIEALLRYKENGSTITLAPREKLMGVDYYVLDLTDKQQRKTRYYVSAKSYRIMMLTYEEDGVKYKRKFYDYNFAQGTLVPYRTVLWADDKIVEETEIGTITFGQKVDENLFASS